MEGAKISIIENKIVITDDFSFSEMHVLLAVLHQAIDKTGLEELILDFSKCSAVYPGPMLGICAQLLKRRGSGVKFNIVLPSDEKLARLFQNANWAYLIQPNRFRQSTFKGRTQIPATQFQSPKEQNQAVNRIVNTILGAIPNIERTDFAALEWSINEITDNVLVHSNSSIGGLVQVSTFHRVKKRVEYIVVDAGAGIPETLRATHPDIRSDPEALERAIKENVTRDPEVGQGNGLFGSYQICSRSGGRFQIVSGYAKLLYIETRKELDVHPEKVPYNGTLVVATIDFSSPGLLQEALTFGGKIYHPLDLVETKYESNGSQDVLFVLKNESDSFGSRVAGTPVRTKLNNLARMCPNQKIHVDFSGIPFISSSFADEVFGKLFSSMGPLAFMQRFELRNMPNTVRHLIDKAISQRAANGTKDGKELNDK